jgi:hypothetical protein
MKSLTTMCIILKGLVERGVDYTVKGQHKIPSMLYSFMHANVLYPSD